MLATLGDAAEDIRGDQPSCIAERRLQTLQCLGQQAIPSV
jgi:hypothetical protein